MRPVEIDVIDVQADACLEARDGILLADAADEHRQRRIRAARNLERHIRALLCDLYDVHGAHAVEVHAANN